MAQLIKKIKITTSIELITGLHIGGSSDSVEIGGIDNPVIKIATKDGQPYIPGSSIKGKIRCLLEQIAGSGNGNVGGNKDVNNLFGFSQDNMPSKIIVRDAYLSKDVDKKIDEAERLKSCENLDMPYTEAKWENVIHRVKGTAEHPRQMERIPAGVLFDVEFVVNVWDTDGDGKALIDLLEKGIKALENDYLGGSGSRGYGQIKFSPRNLEHISFDKYFENEK